MNANHTIALISEHASPLATCGGVDAGGQNIAVAELAQQLAALGYSLDIFTRWDDPDLPETVQWRRRVRVVHLKAGPKHYLPKERLLPYMGEFTDNFIRFSRREGHPYRLVHAHFFMSALVAADVKRRLGLPFVVTFHALGKVRRLVQGNSDGFPAERSAIEELVIREADQVIALCPQDRDDLLTLYGANPITITVIPNGFNPEQFYAVEPEIARKKLGLPPDEPLILQLGRMVPRKGVATVVEALARLRQAHGVPARLLVVGGESDDPDPVKTPEIGRLQRLAETEGVADGVSFVGRRDHDALRYFYSAADVFVTVPWYEPFGITPLEAMACGVPVVGSCVGGIKTTVLDGKTGFLVPPRDPDALAERLALLLRNPALRQTMRARGLSRVHREFTWHRVACQTAELYERVAQPAPLSLVPPDAKLLLLPKLLRQSA
jgi:glycosyltransferase involved in cell wall biosynthesis